MFAFAILIKKRKSYFWLGTNLAKPLYWVAEKGTLLLLLSRKHCSFISEVTVDKQGLSDCFSFQYTVGSKTMFAEFRN